MDRYTETSSRNYFQRLGDSFKGVLAGIVLLCGSTYALYWNETRVNLYDVAKESVVYESGKSYREDTLISYTGIVDTNERISDNEFLKPISGIVALSRSVEMYSWVEKTTTSSTESATGSETTETTYSYSKSWTTMPSSSNSFKHPNGHFNPTPRVTTGSSTFKPNILTIDKFNLDSKEISISTDRALVLNETNINTDERVVANYIYIPINSNMNNNNYNNNNMSDDSGRERDSFSSNNNYNSNNNNNSYNNANLSNPQVGDVRISYRTFPSKIKTTVFGVVIGNTISSYKIKNEDWMSKMSNGIYRLFKDTRESALSSLKSEESMKLWVVRIISLIMMYASFTMLFKPLNAVFNILRISVLTRMVTNFISFILTFIIATIAILFGKLASFYGFIGAIIVIIGAIFIIIKFVFNKSEGINTLK